MVAERPLHLSGDALRLCEEVSDWRRSHGGHCAFHELSHEHTRQGVEYLGTAFYELTEAGIASWGLDDSGLVSTIVVDEEVLAALLGYGPQSPLGPRSRTSALAL